MAKTRRVTIDLDKQEVARLDALLKSTGATTARIFRNGLYLMELVIEAGKDGSKVEITDGDGNGTRLTFLF